MGLNAQFDLIIPPGLGDALAALGAEGIAPVPLAGGTNLLVDIRARRTAPERLMSLAKLGSLRGIRLLDGEVHMGGATTIGDMLHDPVLARHAPSLVAQARVFAGQMVRNAATVAGNICYGSPAADAVPPLLALDARVVLASGGERREVPLSAFFLDYKQTARRANELLTEVYWDVPQAPSTDVFYKLARRRGDAITVVGLAVAMTVEEGVCRSVRIALGSVAPTVKRATGAEAVLNGHVLTPELIDEAAERAREESAPIDDIRASAAYRRHGVRVLTRRLVSEAWQHLTGGAR